MSARRPSPFLQVDWTEIQKRLDRAHHAPGRSPSALELLTFDLDGRLHGLDTRLVREVGPVGKLTPIVGAPPLLAGLITLFSWTIA